ncbi:FAD-binding oxidoreductase [Pandoraea apista]|uniref:FAD-binding oxidoreductase n=1 Tax=Pandoraea apista TaxID=93218 RepID=UPI0006583915|nr:FAD-binding oxidoreductase [Pandoraea apista]ALS66394.1 hypothetical protein AT395_16685 [Pandoraea apista]CFB61659.1 CDP-6-deoxy-L-threo-D-glycero-4-hexulose-3-dehydrase reductase [Pandoraea apista]
MSYTITLTDGKTFDCAEDESILDAAARAHIPLAYSCKTGRCSTCKTSVVSGTSRARVHEQGISEALVAAGWILSCVRVPSSDMTLEVDDLGGVVLPEARTLPCKIHALERLSVDVMKVVLRLPPTAKLQFFAGQYIDVIGPGGVRRSYSLASSPTNDDLLELHVREVPGGAMSAYWFERAKPGDLMRLVGPLGTFFLRPCVGKHVVFLATGTGIAPVRAILQSMQTLAPEALPESISVYWGGRLPGDLYIDPMPAGLAVKFIPVLSRAPQAWDGASGYVQNALIADAPELKNSVVYACGSNEMIESARSLLIAHGLGERDFYSDAFVCSAAL